MAKRKALVLVFPKAQTLMCYFHVIRSCEEKLQDNVNRKLIMKDITDLHMCLTQEEFDHKWSCMFRRWLVNECSFTLYFLQQ